MFEIKIPTPKMKSFDEIVRWIMNIEKKSKKNVYSEIGVSKITFDNRIVVLLNALNAELVVRHNGKEYIVPNEKGVN